MSSPYFAWGIIAVLCVTALGILWAMRRFLYPKKIEWKGSLLSYQERVELKFPSAGQCRGAENYIAQHPDLRQMPRYRNTDTTMIVPTVAVRHIRRLGFKPQMKKITVNNHNPNE